MGNSRRLIQPVYDNSDKQLTYCVLMERYKRAVTSEFYFEAMLIVYAMIEDRLRSFLYHIGAFHSMEDLKLNVSSTRNILNRLYFGLDEKAKDSILNINSISGKVNLIRGTLKWSRGFNGVPEEPYLEVLKEEYVRCLDISGMLHVLDEIEEWSRYRNEVIHGLLNKTWKV